MWGKRGEPDASVVRANRPLRNINQRRIHLSRSHSDASLDLNLSDLVEEPITKHVKGDVALIRCTHLDRQRGRPTLVRHPINVSEERVEVGVRVLSIVAVGKLTKARGCASINEAGDSGRDTLNQPLATRITSEDEIGRSPVVDRPDDVHCGVVGSEVDDGAWPRRHHTSIRLNANAIGTGRILLEDATSDLRDCR